MNTREVKIKLKFLIFPGITNCVCPIVPYNLLPKWAYLKTFLVPTRISIENNDSSAIKGPTTNSVLIQINPSSSAL